MCVAILVPLAAWTTAGRQSYGAVGPLAVKIGLVWLVLSETALLSSLPSEDPLCIGATADGITRCHAAYGQFVLSVLGICLAELHYLALLVRNQRQRSTSVEHPPRFGTWPID